MESNVALFTKRWQRQRGLNEREIQRPGTWINQQAILLEHVKQHNILEGNDKSVPAFQGEFGRQQRRLREVNHVVGTNEAATRAPSLVAGGGGVEEWSRMGRNLRFDLVWDGTCG